MPSKLPIIKANTSQDNIEKMKIIASANKRSVAKELEWLIERHIAEYEKEHGEIQKKEPTLVKELKEWTGRAIDKETPIIERMKDSAKTGFNLGMGKTATKEGEE